MPTRRRTDAPANRSRTGKSAPRPPTEEPWLCYSCDGLAWAPYPTKPVVGFQVPTLHTMDGEPRPFCDMLCYIGLLFQESQDPDAESPPEEEH